MDPKHSIAGKTGIGKPILVGFVLLLGLMIAISAAGLYFNAQANRRLHTLVENQNVKTRLAIDIQVALAQRALSMHAVSVINDDFEKDAERIRFDGYGANYVHARDAIEKMPLNAQERAVLADMRQSTREARPELEKVMEFALAGEQEALLEQLRNQAMPKQKRISEQAALFIGLQQAQAREALESADSSYQQAKMLMLMLTVSTVLLGVMITFIVSRRVNRQGQQLTVQAKFDSLTNLPNRLMLLEHLQRQIDEDARGTRAFAVMLMDLDRFKEVNDTLGHEYGDLLLKEVGRRLQETVRAKDIIARLGGDEYVIVLNELSQQDVTQIAEKIIAVFDQTFQVEHQSISVSASLGISVYPDHGKTPSALLREADIAMYVAKRSGVGYVVYSPEQDNISREDLSLKGELREAIQQNQLILHFQPKIDHTQHRITGLEALVRWIHPQRGFIPPDKFIPLAEQSGLIGALTRWVLHSALEQLARLHACGHRLSMAVNLSASNLHDPELVEVVVQLLRKFKLDPKYLVLEITEGAVMSSPGEGVKNLHRLDKVGVTLSIDDFGTGYSSLAYLKQLPVDELKIDKSFVLSMHDDENDAVIVRSTIDLAHNLGLKVTAEGVENREAWELLTMLGCDNSQGYFMSKPLAIDPLLAWMEKSPWAIGQPTAFPTAEFWLQVQSA